MAQIVLSTLNAKYLHASFGLRYLIANMGELRSETELIELDINQRVMDIAEILLASEPKILGLSVYIWNAAPMRELVATLKRLRPGLTIVLGGPEVSHETETQLLTAMADFVICGEADLAFAELCRAVLAGAPPAEKIIRPPLPELSAMALPYDEYTDKDCSHRVVYVEASRGCPYKCEFCLSSLDEKVRAFDTEKFLASMDRLLDRGVLQFKFVDRTFNLNLQTSQRILEFFLARDREGLFVHFEMVPDRLPDALRDVIRRFRPGVLQFEVGVQSLDPTVETLISRRQNHAKLAENFRFLREETGVHVHADLICGLPGQSLASIQDSFDTLYKYGPEEIQVGILKRLRGTPIIRHDAAYGMVYSPEPPYEILRTADLDFAVMQRLRRFARFWDMFSNSGKFKHTMKLVLGETPFASFFAFSDWLHASGAKTSGVAQNRQIELLADYLRANGHDESAIRTALVNDYQKGNKRDTLDWLFEAKPAANVSSAAAKLPKRQARHMAADGNAP
jgi:radical SAM superfamily enzyme YgiQ (UPF0313 family)